MKKQTVIFRLDGERLGAGEAHPQDAGARGEVAGKAKEPQVVAGHQFRLVSGRNYTYADETPGVGPVGVETPPAMPSVPSTPVQPVPAVVPEAPGVGMETESWTWLGVRMKKLHWVLGAVGALMLTLAFTKYITR